MSPNLHNHQDLYIQGVLKFLRGCMTKRNKGSRDPSIFISEQFIIANPPKKAKVWGIQKFHERFPNLAPVTGPDATKDDPNKKKLKVQLHELIAKHFQNGIWKYNPRLRLKEMCNVSVTSLNTILSKRNLTGTSRFTVTKSL